VLVFRKELGCAVVAALKSEVEDSKLMKTARSGCSHGPLATKGGAYVSEV
jgi:hypothetical protein